VTPDLSNANWFKSSRSGSAGHCVEVAFLESREVALRDTKDRSRPAHIFTPKEWAAFTAGVKDGEFDNL
jgi:hypothetical protein